MQPKNQNSPNPKQAPGHPGANQPKPDEKFPGKAPDVYGDDRHQKPGHTPGQNPKRNQDHNPDGDPRRGAQHRNPDDQRRDQRQDPQRQNERAHRPGQDRE
jgi:hypothetical protein